MTAHGTLYGLVLAGGRSSRMGQDKSRLSWCGKPLYRHMVSLLIRAGIDQVLISGSGFSPADSVIADVVPGRGPVSGIHAALQRLQNGDRLLVIPVDMPLVPADAIRILGDQQRVCCFTGFNLPVIMPVNTAVLQGVDRSIASDNPRDYALWRLYQRLGGQSIPLPSSMADFFTNANTPEEWHNLVNKVVVQQ